MNKILNKLKRIFVSNFSLRTYLIVCIPVITCLILVLMFNGFSVRNTRLFLEESYKSKMMAACQKNEYMINGITGLVRMLSQNKEFMELMVGGESKLTSENIKIGKQLFEKIKDSSEIIDSIIFVPNKKNIVFGTLSETPLDKFFSEDYRYRDYSIDYWKQFKAPRSEVVVLPPSSVLAKGKERDIIPIVYTRIDKTYISGFLIVNIKVDEMLKNLSNEKITDNSFFAFFNNQTHKMFFDTKSELVVDDKFYEQLLTKNADTLAVEVNNEKCFAAIYSPTESVLGYTYIAFIPDKDIESMMSVGGAVIIFFILILLCIGLLSVHLSVRAMYKPLDDLTDILEKKAEYSGLDGRMNFLNSRIHEMKMQNVKMSSELLGMKSIVKERHIITFLKRNEQYDSIEDTEMIEKIFADFKKEYYCVAQLKMIPTEIFYEQFNTAEYNYIQSGVCSVIKECFPISYKIFMIQYDAETIYILLGLSDNKQEETIKQSLEKVKSLLKNDVDMIKFYYAIGDIYKDFTGLKKSFREANNRLSRVFVLGEMNITVGEDSEDSVNYRFTNEEGNTMFNYLMACKTAEAREIMRNIIIHNLQGGVSDFELVQLYSQFLNLIFRVFRAKSIPYDPENKGDMVLISEIVSNQSEEILRLIDSLIDSIDNSDFSDKVDINAVLVYIQEHYQEDLYLDVLAEQFNTSSKYLSRKFKDVMDINFTEYISLLRIEKAKELLKDTNMSMSEVYETVGFGNRNTFMRVFKKYVGLTPGEYRKASE